MLPDVDHVAVKGIQSALRHGGTEGVLVQVWRASRHYNAVEVVIL